MIRSGSSIGTSIDIDERNAAHPRHDPQLVFRKTRYFLGSQNDLIQHVPGQLVCPVLDPKMSRDTGGIGGLLAVDSPHRIIEEIGPPPQRRHSSRCRRFDGPYSDRVKSIGTRYRRVEWVQSILELIPKKYSPTLHTYRQNPLKHILIHITHIQIYP